MSFLMLDKVKNPAMRKQLEESLNKVMGFDFIPNNVFYVCSVNGSDNSSGEDYTRPKASIDSAIGRCTANKGDVIFVLPGHTETYTTTGAKIVSDIPGITIIGVGNGTNRPTISFGHTGTTTTWSAANVKVFNILFLTAVDQVVTFGTVSGANNSFINCEFKDVTDKEVVTDLTVTGDGFQFINNFKNGYVAGNANDCVLSLNGVDNAVIEGNIFMTKALTAIIEFVTAASSNIIIQNNIFYVASTNLTKDIIDTITGSTYVVKNCFDMEAGAGFSGGSGAALALDDVSSITSLIGTLTNTGGAATLGGILGDVKNKSIASRLIDGTFKKTIANGTLIPNNAQAADGLLCVATDGEVMIENITWQRAGTSFAGPTNYEFSTDNVAGATGAAAPIGVALLAKFAANTTSVLSLDGATKQLPFILETGKSLFIHGDDAATSAGGSTNFYIKYKRIGADAYLA